MHMADALLSPAVGITMCAVSTGMIGLASAKVQKSELGEKKLPMMAVAGAFVFAAQMINFTIPGTGSSGHIGGGILLAAMLGGYPAFLTICAVLLIQCLFFADGGLLALGCNIFNMGVIPCLAVYPLLFKPLLHKGVTKKRLTTASVCSAVVALQLGAFAVVLQTLLSSITALPFGAFVSVMQPIHLAIGLVEGLITAAVLCFVQQVRPELLESAAMRQTIPQGVPMKRVVILFSVLALLIGGGLSLAASAYPDGLEWSMEKTAGTAELQAEGRLFEDAAAIQEQTALLPDYEYPSGSDGKAVSGTTAAGLIGTAMTFVLAGGAGLLIYIIKKRKHTAE
ncbi:MAG: energy-coupling factor ABC transporter permease [Eubacteriales bacterium]|nr:energy-coupling factor ABC transporter permease [Eubacteriales bacterium]